MSATYAAYPSRALVVTSKHGPWRRLWPVAWYSGRHGIVAGPAALTAFRWLVAACQAATLLITWPLWQVHRTPPMLPALPLPEVALGLPLLVSLAVVLLRPRLGVPLHTALLVYAILIDQTRLQPPLISLAFLLWGTLEWAAAQTVARAHLVSLWLWAGLNKLLSTGFLHGNAQWILTGLMPDAPAPLRENIGYVFASAELGTGLLALVPRTRPLAAVMAFVLHAGILLSLSPLGRDYGVSVWPWNVALAFAGFALIAPWKESPLRSLRQCPPAVRLLVLALMVAPAGYYLALTPANLAHNLYSANTPGATCTNPEAVSLCRSYEASRRATAASHVVLPAEPRLFEAFFRRTCEPGDVLVIHDGRRWSRLRGRDQRVVACPSN